MGRPPGSRNKTATTTSPEMEIFDQEAETNEARAVVALQPAPKSVIKDMSDRYGMEPPAFEAALRATVVPKDVSPAQFAAFLLVAKEYRLNPLTKEIYAYPARSGGIIPIVSVDGWLNLVNSHQQCDGFSFEMEKEGDRLISCTCTMYRKDRTHPVQVTEYFSECVRSTEPWKMKHRMLRHKALIQAARYAFGFSGIYDEDEGQKIAEIDPSRDTGPPRDVTTAPKQIEHRPEESPEEQVRDGTPPKREAKPAEKEDPISSGPPRRAPTTDPKPADSAPKPHRIPGEGHTYESWAEKYCDLIRTSPDIATVYEWIDANSKEFSPTEGAPKQAGPLTRLTKGKPSVAATVKKATEQTMEALRDAAAKAEKAAAKAAKPAATMPSDMTDDAAGVSDAPMNPEDILALIDQELAAVEDPDTLQDVWDTACDPLVAKLEFPPDQDAAQAIYNKHEKRLGGD